MTRQPQPLGLPSSPLPSGSGPLSVLGGRPDVEEGGAEGVEVEPPKL